MIERCLILRMSQDECVEALARHARIQPLVTLTGISLSLSLIFLVMAEVAIAHNIDPIHAGANPSTSEKRNAYRKENHQHIRSRYLLKIET